MKINSYINLRNKIKGILCLLVFLFLLNSCKDGNNNVHKISHYIVDSFYIFNAYNPDNLRFINDSTLIEIKTISSFEIIYYKKKNLFKRTIYIPYSSKNIFSYGKFFEIHKIRDTNVLFIETNSNKILSYKIFGNDISLVEKYEISNNIIPENYIAYLNYSVLLNDSFLVFRVIYDDFDEIFKFLSNNNLLYVLNLKSNEIFKIDLVINFNPIIKYHFEYKLMNKINKNLVYLYHDTILLFRQNSNYEFILYSRKTLSNKNIRIRYNLTGHKNISIRELDLLNYNSYYKNIFNLKDNFLITYYTGGDTTFNGEFYHYQEYETNLILTDSNFKIMKYIINDFKNKSDFDELLLINEKKLCFSYMFDYKKKLNKFYVFDFK